MQHKSSLLSLLGVTLLIVAGTKVCHGQQQTLMCYVCDDCKTINVDTPLVKCNEDFFNSVSTTTSSTVSTTHEGSGGDIDTTETTITTNAEEDTSSSTTTTTTEVSTTTTDTTSTTPTTTTTTETTTTTDTTTPTTTTTSTTTIPTAPTAVPTPPTPPTVPGFFGSNDTVQIVQLNNTTTQLTPVLHVRQMRSLVQNAAVTYHCYHIVKTDANNTLTTQRGCVRNTSPQSVCGAMEQLHGAQSLSKCSACTRNQCNGSGALKLSVITLLMGALAAMLRFN